MQPLIQAKETVGNTKEGMERSAEKSHCRASQRDEEVNHDCHIKYASTPSSYELRHEGYYTVNDVLTIRNVTALLVVEKSELAKHRPLGH